MILITLPKEKKPTLNIFLNYYCDRWPYCLMSNTSWIYVKWSKMISDARNIKWKRTIQQNGRLPRKKITLIAMRNIIASMPGGMMLRKKYRFCHFIYYVSFFEHTCHLIKIADNWSVLDYLIACKFCKLKLHYALNSFILKCVSNERGKFALNCIYFMNLSINIMKYFHFL